MRIASPRIRPCPRVHDAQIHNTGLRMPSGQSSRSGNEVSVCEEPPTDLSKTPQVVTASSSRYRQIRVETRLPGELLNRHDLVIDQIRDLQPGRRADDCRIPGLAASCWPLP
ncbi:hypothetical protein ACFV80_32795 [Streptomyces sp. NPDC059862]|uniref:hypothetical protein n=1 Tax=Streptomyces sp. NPDC059862 TaxID=3346975 RepID=UPI003649BB38